MAGKVVAIAGSRVVPIVGAEIHGGTVLIEDGRIAAVGDSKAARLTSPSSDT